MMGKRVHRKKLVAVFLGLILAGGAAATEAATVNVTLYARAGTITLVDGKTLFARGYAAASGGAIQIPGPQIAANQGDTVNITLVNQDAVSHKLSVTGISLANQTVAPGGSYTYSFTASQAGSRLYYDSADGVKNRVLGMYGALVIRPTNGSNTQSWNNGPTFDQQKVWVVSDLDERWNTAVGNGQTVPSTYNPNYFLINGKGGHDAMTDPATAVSGKQGVKVLIRHLNAGGMVASNHFHGYHYLEIANNGVPRSDFPEKDTSAAKPLEGEDLLVTLDLKGTYPVHSHIAQAETANGVYLGGMVTMIVTN
jgi:FtsP/CotA-like multicopper oxidase with cupredoxin domain